MIHLDRAVMELIESDLFLLAKLMNALINRPSFMPLLLPFLHFKLIPSLQRRDSASAS